MNPPLRGFLDTRESLLLRFQTDAAQFAPVPGSPSGRRHPRIFPVPVPRVDHAGGIPLVDGGRIAARSPDFTPAAGAGGDLRLLRDSSAALDAFLQMAGRDAFLERVRRYARGIFLHRAAGTSRRAGTAGADRAAKLD